MAAGFKTATVNASDVPSSQTNFPVYVDLSRIGITTQAEADSVRVYADSGKTTEWAREIVSASEMWVKVPSLTSTTSIYVDYDGVRSNYANTDTYGRNAVWSAYVFVSHYGDADATGTNTSITNNGSISPGGVSGPFGNATSFNGTTQNFVINTPSGFPTSNNAYTHTVWAYPTAVNSSYFSIEWGATSRATIRSGAGVFVGNYGGNGAIKLIRRAGDDWGPTGQATATTWQHIAAVYNPNVVSIYRNASSIYTSGTLSAGAITLDRAKLGSNTDDIERWAGNLREWRVSSSALSANWLTTEYNNQSDEPGFWGTWSDVGGQTYRSPSGGVAYAGGLTMY